MDKPKENKVRTRVMDILRNHDQEARVIEAQIAAEKESLEADLEFILLESSYPSGQFSETGVRVQSSPNPDESLVRMVDKRDRRRQRANETIGNLEHQLQQIKEVQNLVYTLDTRSKCVLLAPVLPLQVIRRSGRIPSSRKNDRLSSKRNRTEQAIRQGGTLKMFFLTYNVPGTPRHNTRTWRNRKTRTNQNRVVLHHRSSNLPVRTKNKKFMQLCATVCNYLQLRATVRTFSI